MITPPRRCHDVLGADRYGIEIELLAADVTVRVCDWEELPSQAVNVFVPGSTWKMMVPFPSTAVLSPNIPVLPAWLTEAEVNGLPFLRTVIVTAKVAKLTVIGPVTVIVWVW